MDGSLLVEIEAGMGGLELSLLNLPPTPVTLELLLEMLQNPGHSLQIINLKTYKPM